MRPGEPWGTPAADEPSVVVRGDDAALAGVLDPLLGTSPSPVVRFLPDASDLARAVGVRATSGGEPTVGVELGMDALRVLTDGWQGTAVNAVVVGTPPDRLRRWTRSVQVEVAVDGRTLHEGPATTVVVANGEWLRTLDLVPRGHPGDGRVEVQVYALAPGERAVMRHRARSGTHLPHPRIRATTGRKVRVRVEGPTPVEVDGAARGSSTVVDLEVLAGAYRLVT
jgi:hypothetical protein